MKTRNLILLAALAVSLLTGCSKNEADPGLPEVPDLTDTPIRVNAGVNSLTTGRAGYETGALAQGTLGLYLSQGVSGDRYNCENKKVSCTGGTWAYADGTLYWSSSSATATYSAYLPYQETAPTQLTVSTEQTAETFTAEDFLYAKEATETATAGGISIAFDHKLCKLNVELSRGTELTADITFTKVTLVECCALEAGFDVTTGTVTPATAGTQSITLYTSGTTHECLLVPQTIAAGELKVRIGDSNGTFYEYTSTEELIFASGNSYTLKLTVGRNRVESGTMTANAWNETTASGGELETE